MDSVVICGSFLDPPISMLVACVLAGRAEDWCLD
jgi:hypothetical protein